MLEKVGSGLFGAAAVLTLFFGLARNVEACGTSCCCNVWGLSCNSSCTVACQSCNCSCSCSHCSCECVSS